MQLRNEVATLKVIDAHVHLAQCIAGTGASGELRACGEGRGMYPDGTTFALIPPQFGGEQVTPQAVLGLMDRNSVERAVLLQGNFLGFQNQYSYDAMRAYPGRFLAAAAYDPCCRNRDAIVQRLFEELRIPVVKFEVSDTSGLMCNHPTIALDGALMEREYDFADAHGLVFVIDIGKLGSASSQIEALRRAILRHAGMKFVVCHLLAPAQAQEQAMCEGLQRLALKNVWFDIASLQHNLRPDAPPYPVTRHFLLQAVRLVGADRLLFGSDLPSTLCGHRYEDLIACVSEHPNLSRQEKELILYENAKAVFWDGN